MKYIEGKGRANDRHGVFPINLEHVLGAKSLVGRIPLRYFSHLLVVVIALAVLGFGSLGRITTSGMLSLHRAVNPPPAFTHQRITPEADLLVKNADVVTRQVNRPRQGITRHVVAEGETVFSIADRYELSLQTIYWANDLEEDSVLRPGQELIILPVSGVLYKVREEDTIEDIAWKYKSDVRAIVDFNQLTDASALQAGDLLVVPGGRKEDRPRPVLTSRSMQRPPDDIVDDIVVETRPQALKPSIYEVRAGDTVAGIAERFSISQDSIIATNNLGSNPDLLSPGQSLTILPVTGVLYTVKEGDTLNGIAGMFDVKADEINTANALSDSNIVAVGQKLIVPGAKAVWRPPVPPEPTLTHIVQPGDSVRYIAEIYNVNPDRVISANGLRNANVVQIGQKLEIPGGRAPAPAVVSRPAPAATSRAAAPAPRPAPKPVAAAAPEPAPPPAASGQGWKIVEVASKYLGYRYRWGGTSPATGFDCSGYVWYVYKTAGSYVPRDLWGQLQAGPRVKQDSLQPGDIVFFENTYTAGLSHNGIYIGGGRFIHAASETQGVIISSLSERYWAARYYAANRPW